MRKFSCSGLLGLLCLAIAPAGAATFVTPTQFDGVEADGSFTTPVRALARAGQAFLDSSVMPAFTEPVYLTGISYRADGPSALPPGTDGTPFAGAWPRVDIDWTRYDIALAVPSVGDANSLSTTFANNIGSNFTQVRSGGLVIPAGSFTFGPENSAGPNPFIPTIEFTTPYLYTPGQDLLIENRHNGYGTEENVQLNVDYDLSTSNPLFGSIVATSGVDATSGSRFGGVVYQFTYQPVPEPAGLTLLGLASLTMRRRRRD